MANYHVASIGKLDLNKGSEDWGLDGKNHLSEWGFSDGFNSAGKPEATNTYEGTPLEPYMDYLKGRSLDQVHVDDMSQRDGAEVFRNTDATPLAEDAYCDNWLGQSGLDLLQGFPSGKPWFFQVNFSGPHYPMDITQSMKASVAGDTYPQPIDNSQYTPEKHNAIRQNYSAMIENIDRWLGLYVEALGSRGDLENTLVIYASDHGEMLGDHGYWRKSQPFQPSVGVPLVMAGPGVQGGRTSGAIVSLMDLAATFLDFGGLSTPAEMDSISFRNVLEGRWAAHRQYAFSGLTTATAEAQGQPVEIIDWRMVFDGRYKYLPQFSYQGAKDAVPWLFDLVDNPLEDTNYASSKPDEVARLSQALTAMQGHAAPRNSILGLY
jgi:arylsulfatase A-like enzyme